MTIDDAYRTAAIALHANHMPTEAAIKDAQRQVQRFFVAGDTRRNADAVAEIVSVMRFLIHDRGLTVSRARDRMDQIAKSR